MMSRKSRVGTFLVAAMLAGAVSAPLVAAAPDTIKKRIAGFAEIGKAFKTANDQLKTDSPDVKAVQAASRQIQTYSRQVKGWFPKGSEAKPGLKSAAKPEIWKQAGQFQAAANDFVAKADALAAAAAKGNDVAAMKAAGKAVGATCSSCHRAFRAESKS